MLRHAVQQPDRLATPGGPGRRTRPVRALLAGLLVAMLAGPASAAAGEAAEPAPLTVAVPADHPPWSYSDGDNVRGILVDLWQAWGRAAATPVQLVPLGHDQAITAVRAGEVDVIGGVIAAEPLSGLLATRELIHVPIEAYARAGSDVGSVEELSDVFVGVVADHGVIAEWARHHEEIDMIGFPDTAALYDAVASGTLDAFVDESQTARHELARTGALGEFDRLTPPVAVVGVRALAASQPTLRRVEAGLETMGGEARRAIVDRWTLASPRRVSPGMATLWLFGIALVAGLIWHSLTVRSQVRHRTAALEASRNELAALNERLQAQATHDLLTGLANRRLFVQRIGQAVSAARRSGDRVGILYVDLDDFKTINDRWGHAAGDAALATIADRIRGCVRESDTAARLGGDEFAVLVDRIEGVEEAQVIAAKLATMCGDPLELGGATHRIGASIGIAIYPDDGHDADALLANADRRMYLAKMRAKGLEFLPRAATGREATAGVSD